MTDVHVRVGTTGWDCYPMHRCKCGERIWQWINPAPWEDYIKHGYDWQKLAECYRCRAKPWGMRPASKTITVREPLGGSNNTTREGEGVGVDDSPGGDLASR